MKNTVRLTVLFILLSAVISLAVFARLRIEELKELPFSQQAARRFSGQSGKRFVQISAFFHPNDGVSEFHILLFNEALQAGLRASGNVENGSGNPLIHAFSAASTLAVQSARGAFNHEALGVGRDFFFFHPYTLMYGSLMENPAGNGIIVNDRAAWMLFGAVDVVGLPVLIHGEAYVVSGIVSLENDRASRDALSGTDCMVFVPYAVIGTGVTCYETVLPEPVMGYGEYLFANLGLENTVVNSTRYSSSAIRKAIRSLPAYSMDAFAASLPYWENAAKNIETRIILWTILLYFGSLPVIALLVLILFLPLIKHVIRSVKTRA